MRLGDLCCVECGAEELFALKPGRDAVYGPLQKGAKGGNVVGTLVAVELPDLAWCRACACARFDLTGR